MGGDWMKKRKNHFKKDRYKFDEQVKERHRIQKIFLKKYGKPVLVHSTPLKKNFVRILKESKLKLPLDHCVEKKCPYMEKLVGVDNCLYFSLGFPYVTRYSFKYSLIFDLDMLKKLEYHSKIPVWSTYKRIVDFIYEKDPEYFKVLRSKNKICEEVVDRYLHTVFEGKTRNFIDFWRDEKTIFEWVQDYPNQKEIKKIIKDTSKEFLVKYPDSSKLAKKQCLERYIPEILSKKEISLSSPCFLGFYISGNIPKDIQTILKKKFKGRIIFDGKKIEVIG